MTFIKASCSHMQQTMPQMTQSKLAKRSFDSFAIFKDPDYITGIQSLGTLQPLVDDREGIAYFGIKEESWKACGWSATEDDFEKGSVLFNTTHTFSGRRKERMHAFTAPKLQIIHASEILVVDDSIVDEKGKSKNIIVGDLSMPHINEAFEEDKKSNKENRTPRRFSTRVKYLVNVLKKDNTPAHSVPIVLTVKGLVSVDLSEQLKTFYTKMEKAMSKALGMDAGVKFDKRVKSTFVFIPTLAAEVKGFHKNEVCAVKSVKLPTYTDQISAQESILELTIPDESRPETWKQLEDDFLGEYINKHSQQEAAKLAGAYGVIEGVALKPQGALPASASVIGERDDDTGEVAF